MHFIAKLSSALALAAVALSVTGCTQTVVQTATPPTLLSEPPAHAVAARYMGRDVHVTYTATPSRPTRGWLVVERFPDDGHLSVVPAYPYASYVAYHGIVGTVYADHFRGRTLVSGTDTPRAVPEAESVRVRQ